MEAEHKILPMTKVVDIRQMPEEVKAASPYLAEPEISTALQLGEYICKNKGTFPPDLLKITEEKNNLTELCLKHLRLNEEGIKHLSVVLYFLKSLKFANFHDMQLEPKDLAVLSPAIAKLSNLEEINFTANNIGPGCKHLSLAIGHLSKLIILDLTDCSLRAGHMTTLSSDIKKLTKLELLKLSFNHIEDYGCDALCKIIPEMPLLVEIELFTCGITNISYKCLENAFKNSNLHSVLLGNNQFTPKFEGKLKKAFPFVHFGIKHYRCNIF
ncbi:hypothetical protein SteCoe_34233 [Stentor coeruleus]|uniref:Uncharacterized protein n=1 Tax=Stentor coeruleus TaxID=5963 RepID=A0A1R2AUY7_9CILI|nr:hypothetical protein SteCoe_34233 [Stentor coeruleus]